MPVFEPYSSTMHPLVFFAIFRHAVAKDRRHPITNWKEQHQPNDHRGISWLQNSCYQILTHRQPWYQFQWQCCRWLETTHRTATENNQYRVLSASCPGTDNRRRHTLYRGHGLPKSCKCKSFTLAHTHSKAVLELLKKLTEGGGGLTICDQSHESRHHAMDFTLIDLL